ncbi:MAG: hypothetical protein U5N86_12935 [Planctomycetota bacterium]|nr:hypothetical protein [Planctomycetota bacterium]
MVALCGPSAQRVACSLFEGSEPPVSGSAAAGRFVIGEDVVDRCVLARTREDCYEFHLHASRVVVEALCRHLRELGFREKEFADPYKEASFLACARTRREAVLRALNTPESSRNSALNYSATVRAVYTRPRCPNSLPYCATHVLQGGSKIPPW